MTEPLPAPVAQDRPPPDKPSTIRLVIRATIIPDEPAQAAEPRSSNLRAPTLIAGLIAVAALIGIGISVFRHASAPGPVADQETHINETPPARPASSEPALEVRPAPPPTPEISSAAAASALPTSPEPIDEVVPHPAHSALQTIRGTVRVAVRVTLDSQGRVANATSVDAGPSRYFERQALDAARKWTFTPANDHVNSAEPRTVLLRFHFTREGATAFAAPSSGAG